MLLGAVSSASASGVTVDMSKGPRALTTQAPHRSYCTTVVSSSTCGRLSPTLLGRLVTASSPDT